jgi:hypothetical protein
MTSLSFIIYPHSKAHLKRCRDQLHILGFDVSNQMVGQLWIPFADWGDHRVAELEGWLKNSDTTYVVLAASADTGIEEFEVENYHIRRGEDDAAFMP